MEFRIGDKVYVNGTSHDASLTGAEGTISYIASNVENKIGVSIFGMVNPMALSGYFWFNETELIRAKDHRKSVNPFSIKNVYFNDPVTVVMWEDGTKTIVRCGENEEYDPEKGLAMAISKKALGNKGSYYDEFKKWVPGMEYLCETCEYRNKFIVEAPCFACIVSHKYANYKSINTKK